MALNDDDSPIPTFLRFTFTDEDTGQVTDTQVYFRSDFVMDFLFNHLPFEDAQRVWSKMVALRMEQEDGAEVAQDFLDAFGVDEH